MLLKCGGLGHRFFFEITELKKNNMGETKNLNRTEGIKQLKELAENIRIAMFCTKTDNIPLETRPMATQQVDDHGNIWFFSAAESDKNIEIKDQDQVQLIYANPSSSQFLSIA